MPEAWNGQISNIEAYVKEGTIEPSTGSGTLNAFSIFAVGEKKRIDSVACIHSLILNSLCG